MVVSDFLNAQLLESKDCMRIIVNFRYRYISKSHIHEKKLDSMTQGCSTGLHCKLKEPIIII